jgi:predicted transcriptional regulator
VVGLFKSYQTEQASVFEPSNKKLKFLVRLTYRNTELKDETVSHILSKLSQIEPLIIQSFKVFRKLHYQFKNFNAKLEQLIQNDVNSQSSLIDKAVMGQIQYLSNRALELSYLSSIQDCFKLLNTVVRELYNYEKVNVL